MPARILVSAFSFCLLLCLMIWAMTARASQRCRSSSSIEKREDSQHEDLSQSINAASTCKAFGPKPLTILSQATRRSRARFLPHGGVSVDEKSEKFQLFRYRSAQSGFPMRVSDSSVGSGAGQFHTARWATVLVSAGGPSQSVSLARRDAPVTAEGGLSP